MLQLLKKVKLHYIASAEKIGYPVIINASKGGGGKGIRKVENTEDFPNAYKQVFNFFY